MITINIVQYIKHKKRKFIQTKRKICVQKCVINICLFKRIRKTLRITKKKHFHEKDNVINEAKQKHVRKKMIFISIKIISEQIVSDTKK